MGSAILSLSGDPFALLPALCTQHLHHTRITGASKDLEFLGVLPVIEMLVLE